MPIGEFSPQLYGPSGPRQYTGDAAPTTGTYGRGDTVYNSAPTTGGVFLWVCTVAGSPGTWKTVSNS